VDANVCFEDTGTTAVNESYAKEMGTAADTGTSLSFPRSRNLSPSIVENVKLYKPNIKTIY
jgi:hypothetical protein